MARPKPKPTPNDSVVNPCVYATWAVAAVFFFFTFLAIVRIVRSSATNGV